MSLGFNNNTESQIATQSCVLEPDFTHAIAIGQTGCGKTTGFILPHLKDRIERGHGVLLFDYKGKEHQSLKAIAHQAGAIDRVEELGKPWGVRVNLLSLLGENGLLALLGELGQSNESFWSESAMALVRDTYHVLSHGHRLARGGACAPIEAPAPTLRSLFEALSGIDAMQEMLGLYHEIADLSLEYLLGKREQGASVEPIAFLLKEAYALQKALKALEEYRDPRLAKQDNLASGNLGIILSANGVLRQFASYDCINDPQGADLIEALSKGALIAIDTQTLGAKLMRPLMSSVVSRLVKRTSRMGPQNPISIFADEAQRVLDARSDLGDDVLRESKVELVLATQDLGQLVESLGATKARSLMTNIKHQVLFKGQPIGWEGYRNICTEGLEPFAYLQPGTKPLALKAQPLFVDKGDRLYAQWAYQQSKAVLKGLTDGQKPALLHYDEEEFKESGQLEAWELSEDKRSLTGNRYPVDALVALTEDRVFDEMIKLLDDLGHYHQVRRRRVGA